jgi:tRNA nucleotidyltransferase/poly(A) polymerase
MRDERQGLRELLAGEEAWFVGGAVRDELLDRPIVDIDVALRDPAAAARRFARHSGGAPFRLSERHGAWRVALRGDRTVDFTPLPDGIEDDLTTRDFTINAIALAVADGRAVDPFRGREDLEARTIRAVSDRIFDDDPLRLLRAVRLEDELGFRLAAETERLVRARAELVTRPAGERILAELRRLSPGGFARLDELGLLAPLGGRLDERMERMRTSDGRLVAVFGERLLRLPVSNELARLTRVLLRATRPPDDSPRSIHRFRKATEPFALEALDYLGAEELRGPLVQAREREPAAPLVRGDELGVPPGPQRGRILAEIAEERAAGTIATREEALELARRRSGPVREDG